MQDILGWLQLLCLGGLCGALGQGARAIVGFKKLNDAASMQSVSAATLIEGSRLIVSFGIGFVVGALAATQIITSYRAVTLQQIMEIAAAGYAGADFLEGFISRQFGSGDAPAAPAPAATAPDGAHMRAADADGYAG